MKMGSKGKCDIVRDYQPKEAILLRHMQRCQWNFHSGCQTIVAASSHFNENLVLLISKGTKSVYANHRQLRSQDNQSCKVVSHWHHAILTPHSSRHEFQHCRSKITLSIHRHHSQSALWMTFHRPCKRVVDIYKDNGQVADGNDENQV